MHLHELVCLQLLNSSPGFECLVHPRKSPEQVASLLTQLNLRLVLVCPARLTGLVEDGDSTAKAQRESVRFGGIVAW